MSSVPLRIVYLIDSLEGDGAERQFCELVKGVAENNSIDAHVGVFEVKSDSHAWILEDAGIAVQYFARRFRGDLLPIYKLIKYIRCNRIQLIHTYLTLAGEYGLIAAKLTGIPIIASSIRDGKSAHWRKALRIWYQTRLCDLAVANSRAGVVERFRKWPVNCRVIYNGFDFGRVHAQPEAVDALRDELNVLPQQDLICMVARLEAAKDHETLIYAFREVRKERPRATLILAGTGPTEKRLRDLCRNLELHEHVQFVGYRKNVEVLLSVCKISVLLTNTKIHLEGLSNTIIESMALGRPVIATSGGGTDEIFNGEGDERDGGAVGIMVKPFDVEGVAQAIIRLLRDEFERHQLGQRAATMVRRRFNVERFVQENLALYEELIPKN